MSKLKVGDQVIVIAGRDKCRTGKILSLSVARERVHVEGVNLRKKCVKANPQAGKSGGIVEKEFAIHISNVALFNPTTQKRDKVCIKKSADGKNVRYFKSNDERVDV